MVIYEAINAVKEIIANSDSPRFEAELIVMSAMNLSRAEFIINSRSEVSEGEYKRIFTMAKRRSAGEPLAYILGSAEFMGLPFKVNRATLIPRSDTETLVEKVIERIGNAPKRVLDIGTGSGCIGISIAKLCKNADVTLLDISGEALSIAKENARLNGVKVKTEQCDILSDIPAGAFDVIVSNPPYIRDSVIPALQTEVKDYEPLTALSGGADGLRFYVRIADIAPRLLTHGGILAFEIGYDQGAAVMEIMSGYKNVFLFKDLCGNDRVVIGEVCAEEGHTQNSR